MTWQELAQLPNQCQPLIDDPNCSEIKRECSEGWFEDETQRCMAWDVVFECSEDNSIVYETTDTTNVCTGMLPCMGSDCDTHQEPTNTAFVDAMVAGSIMDNIDGDMECTDPNDPASCEVFPGEFEYCSSEVTGLGQDCCEEASGVDIVSYILLSKQLLKLNQYTDAGAFGQGVAGAYQELKQPITDGLSAIKTYATDTLRSASESVFGNTESVSNGVSAISTTVETAMKELTQAAYELIYDVAPDALKEFLFDNAAKYALDPSTELLINESITNTLSTIMAVYTVYNLTKLALTLLTACDDNEIDMSVKLAQRQCFTVGNRYCSKDVLGICYQRRQNHCCFSSILARIIAKEAYDQLGINPLPFGNTPSVKSEIEASCPGISAQQLSQIDFNRPSMQTALQEWVGLMLEAEIIPESTDEAYLTGPAIIDSPTCPDEEVPVMQCYIDQFGANVCQQARDPSGQLIYTTQPGDCGKQVKGGQIFNSADRVIASDRIAGPNGYINGADARVQEAKNQISTIVGNVDCNLTPKPPICLFGFDPTQ
jgi:conjugal transfer mating pair stabilization protein TraN